MTKALVQTAGQASITLFGRVALDCGEPLDRIRILFDEIDQQRRLGIRPRAALLPVFERANVCPEIDGEKGAREVEAFTNTYQLFRRHLRRRLVLERMRAQGPLSFPRIRQSCHTFTQFAEQVTLGGAFRFGLDDRFHTLLLASSSALIIALSVLRCCAVRSDISSLS